MEGRMVGSDAGVMLLASFLLVVTLCGVPALAYQRTSCLYNFGSITIDLKGVGSLRDETSSAVDYWYNPCNSSDKNAFPDPECTGAAICQHGVGGEQRKHAVGLLEGVRQFSNNSVLTLSYSAPANQLNDTEGCEGGRRYAHVNVICANNTDSFKFNGELPACTYNFTLTTQYACTAAKQSHGLSTGSILLILFVVAVAVYLVGGILYKRCVGGARGVEQIPNIEFWKSVPGLVRDGCRFVTSPCRRSSQYVEI